MKLRPRIALVSCLVALTSVGVTGALLIRQSRAYSTEELLQRQLLLTQARAAAVGDELETASRELVRLSQMAEVDLSDNDLRPSPRSCENGRSEISSGTKYASPPDQSFRPRKSVTVAVKPYSASGKSESAWPAKQKGPVGQRR